ncbi:hypothetical protein EMIHUDRAFT_197596 [Emiliania huxleyi CCMP1516]|uniref:DUF2997 domain-containing protein n=2 Tax=Emiliania huxleyi TaxID=2903 RepID=A0A0D3IUJ8_EMIH1|nr:hypothetical protein EMIHUDRAFT_197596 [Emiliania huxleyi CCMP1516]EOD14933.1 hypothetical protein EMIHUDRAFT_197596 [Emiliania huxleyi CCMP1516]|eukprot:XP_005767362.1 hypothetical protein EMIHUDRAFT_197596 [Emiliania huxleyi CCMP1516]
MEMQELEFIIHADGRVEERVRGVKGANCQEITAKIESALGEVYHTEATEEMYEVEVQNTNENTNSADERLASAGPPFERGKTSPASRYTQAVSVLVGLVKM